MGRDDARPVGGLQGGRAPAAAFSAFMRNATANSPVANLTTSLAPPEDQMEPDDEAYGIIENGADPGQLVDPDGMPLGTSSGADRKRTRLNSSHLCASRMPSSACKKKTHQTCN